MASTSDCITHEQANLIRRAKLFFVASAAPDLSPGPLGQGPVNLSPKGGAPLHIIDDRTVAYLDFRGSGNETARHAQHNGPLTLMVMSLDAQDAAIVRLYGHARVTPLDQSPTPSNSALTHPASPACPSAKSSPSGSTAPPPAAATAFPSTNTPAIATRPRAGVATSNDRARTSPRITPQPPRPRATSGSAPPRHDPAPRPTPPPPPHPYAPDPAPAPRAPTSRTPAPSPTRLAPTAPAPSSGSAAAPPYWRRRPSPPGAPRSPAASTSPRGFAPKTPAHPPRTSAPSRGS